MVQSESKRRLLIDEIYKLLYRYMCNVQSLSCMCQVIPAVYHHNFRSQIHAHTGFTISRDDCIQRNEKNLQCLPWLIVERVEWIATTKTRQTNENE